MLARKRHATKFPLSESHIPRSDSIGVGLLNRQALDTGKEMDCEEPEGGGSGI